MSKKSLKWLIESIKPVLDTFDEPITAVDKDGYFIYYNLASARLDGTDPEQVIGHHLLEINQWLTPETSTLLRCLKERTHITNSYQAYQGIAGRQTYYLHTVTPLFSADKELIGAIEIGRTVKEHPSKLESVITEAPKIITTNETLLAQIERIGIFANTDLPILIYGETGTGKELFAQSAHALSGRSARPMMSLNCAAIPETLLESTLFGTTKGAFTGAENRKGLFTQADGGTLFLDEINSMPIALQSKLLRVLQDGNYLPLGAQHPLHSDVRLITALNQDPHQAIKEGKFREDLYYRLNIGEITISPLRERPKDIALLAQAFVAKFAPKLRPEVTMVEPKALETLIQHTWPGNVRELENVIQRSLLLHTGGSSLKKMVLTSRVSGSLTSKTRSNSHLDLQNQLKAEEKQIIQETLKNHQGNISNAAKALGIPRTTLNSKIARLKIQTN